MGRRPSDTDDDMVSELRDRLNYDPHTGILTWKKVRKRKLMGSEAGFMMNSGYMALKIGTRRIQCHRVAYAIVNGAIGDGVEIDHINGVKHDNRISNLRACSASQNRMNVALMKNNTSGVKGVSFCRSSGKYRAEIMVNYKSYYLGEFSSIDEASKAVSSVRANIHKEYSNHGEFKKC